jgi:hypothetical protein
MTTAAHPAASLAAHPRADVAPDHALAALSGIAVALGHGVDVDSLLADLASGVRRSLDADRVSVLLLDDAGRLSPAVAVARHHDVDLWQQFRQMPPIALDDLHGAHEAMAAGRAVVIDDAASSPWIPSSWQRTFSLASLALAPLSVAGEPGGVIVVERPSTSTSFTDDHLALLEGMAALAGVAVTRLRGSAAAARLDHVASAFAAIRAARTPRAVAEHALAAMLDAAKVSHGLLALLDADTADVVAVRGAGLPEPGRYPLSMVPAEVLRACYDAWESPVRRPVDVTVDRAPYVVVPIPSEGRVTEIVLLADVAGLALRDLWLTADRDWFRRVAMAAADAAVPGTVELVRSLLAEAGIDLVRVVADRASARQLGLSAAAAGAVARQLTRWRRNAGVPAAVTIGADTVIPLVVDGASAVAALVVRLPLERDADDDRLRAAAGLMTAAIACDLATRSRAALERLAVDADARTATAEHCYREAAQVLAMLTEHLSGPTTPEARVIAACRIMADRARRLVRDASDALAPTARMPRLRSALAALAAQVFAHGGPEVVVRQHGRVPVLEPAVQVALLQATRRLLALLRDSRSAATTVHLEARGHTVVVTLRCEHLLEATADPATPGLHAAMTEARRWMHGIGGDVEVVADPPGCRFEMPAPADSRRPERVSPVPTPEEKGEVVPLQSASRPTA